MKYIGAISMILIGALLITLTATVPGFSVVNITTATTTPSLTYNMTSSYPSATTPFNVTIFPSSTSVTITVTFSTNYYFSYVQSSGTYATGQVTILDFNTSNFVGVYSTNWAIRVVEYSQVIPIYKIMAFSSFNFSNPITGGNHIYEISWESILHYSGSIQTASGSEPVSGSIMANGKPVFGKFSPSTVYPGYFILQNCTSSWSPVATYSLSMSNSSQINIQIPSTQSGAYLNFIYVEYNASGNTLAGFSYAYVILSTTGTAQWRLTNTTTYNNYPALYMHVILKPGTYTINGYAVYNYGQNGGLEQLFEMSSTWNVSQMGQVNFNNNQIITYILGSLLIVLGVVDAWRWHI